MSLQAILQDRLTLSEAVEIVGRLLGNYPYNRDQSKSYIGALAACLVAYPRMVAELVADPVRGVPRECKFLPTPADVIAWCERQWESIRTPLERSAARESTEEQTLHRRVQDKNRETHKRPAIEELKAMYGERWGIRDPFAKSKFQWVLTTDQLKAEGGLSQAQWDALPNAGDAPNWKKLNAEQERDRAAAKLKAELMAGLE